MDKDNLEKEKKARDDAHEKFLADEEENMQQERLQNLKRFSLLQ